MPNVAKSVSNSQKAALLIQALGRERAQEILEQLPPEQAERIRQAMLALAAMPNETKRAMLRELRALTAPPPAPTSPYLATLTPARAAELLAGEPARLVALLLAVLPADRRQAITAHLPAGERAAVRALAGEVTPPAELVSQHLEQALRAKAEHFQFREAAQGAAAQEMLAPAAPLARPTAPVAPPPATLTFAMLAALDRALLRDILARAAVDDLVLALRGVDQVCGQRVLQALPARMRAAVRTRMKAQAPMRLQDITGAQQRLCRLAQEVIEESFAPREVLAHA